MGRDSPEMDAVEVRFRGSMGGQGRKGAVLVRMKVNGDKGNEAMELLHELHQMHDETSDLPLMEYPGFGEWQV